jgi:hypothetical protein
VNHALLSPLVPANTPGYAQCDPPNTEVYLLATFRFHTRHRIPWLVKKLLRFSRTVLHVVICLLNKYFVLFSVVVFCCLGSNTEQLSFVDAWKGHRRFVFMMYFWTDIYIGHCPPSCFTVVQHFGNSLQNRFYRQCPVFSKCVSYATLHIFDLNFWSHLWSLTAKQECRMCGVEKDNWYTMMKTIYTKWKLGGGLYEVTLIITLATFPFCSWAVKQWVWYSNGWQAVIVEFNTNISESM